MSESSSSGSPLSLLLTLEVWRKDGRARMVRGEGSTPVPLSRRPLTEAAAAAAL